MSVGLLMFAACSDSETDLEIELTLVQQMMLDPVALERGEALFTGTCAGFCHSLSPSDTDASFLFDCEWIHGSTEEEIFATVTVGIPGTRMVGFGNNFPVENDLQRIVAYLQVNQRPCS